MKIPPLLKGYNQWCLSKYNDGNHPLYYKDGRLLSLSIHDSGNFLSFDNAYNLSLQLGVNFGFILTKNDPFTCIDLDVIDEESQKRKGKAVNPSAWTTKEDKDRYWSIISTINSYAEFSASGKGVHIWVLGNIGKGCRRDSIEIYSQERYICCTGNAIVISDIRDAQAYLDNMRSQMSVVDNEILLSDSEIEYSDAEIHQIAYDAENSEKYIDLADRGDWQKYKYPSQSEADLALMSMYAFYSKNNAQCKRIFRCSQLGQRDKATKDDKYLDYALKVIRSRQHKESLSVEIQDKMVSDLLKRLNTNTNSNQFLHSEQNVSLPPEAPISAVEFGKLSDLPKQTEGLEWPPGFLGYVAAYIYNSAPRPVKEIAIAAALGLMSGICGKSWSITQSGLNLYIVLLARSGVGKEALHSGVASLITHVESREPSISNFIDLTEYASGVALRKAILKNPCFVNITGEWGKKLKQFAKEDGRNSAIESLRTIITELYQKSGPGNLVGGVGYSKKEDSVSSVNGVSYSFLGETTPEVFFEVLTPAMMADGFLSRFTHIEYNGLRVPLNPNMLSSPDSWLCDYLAELSSHSADLLRRNSNIPVGRIESVAQKLAAFEIECDGQINNSTDECWRQMWNRAALKAAKIAALLAVCDNYTNPVIQDEHLDWAIKLIRADIHLTSVRFESGDIGNGDSSREKKILSIISFYLSSGNTMNPNTKAAQLRDKGIISRQYLQTRTSSISIFEKSSIGSIRTLDLTIKALIDNGYLTELDKHTALVEHNFSGKCYKILDVF